MVADVVDFVDWLESLDDEQLRSYRFELYDRAEIAPPESDVHQSTLSTLKLVYALEENRRVLWELDRENRALAVNAEALAEARGLCGWLGRLLQADAFGEFLDAFVAGRDDTTDEGDQDAEGD